MTKVWKTLQQMERNDLDTRRPAIIRWTDPTGQPAVAVTDAEKAEALAHHVQQVYQPGRDPHFDGNWERHVNNYVNNNPAKFKPSPDIRQTGHQPRRSEASFSTLQQPQGTWPRRNQSHSAETGTPGA